MSTNRLLFAFADTLDRLLGELGASVSRTDTVRRAIDRVHLCGSLGLPDGLAVDLAVALGFEDSMPVIAEIRTHAEDHAECERKHFEDTTLSELIASLDRPAKLLAKLRNEAEEISGIGDFKHRLALAMGAPEAVDLIEYAGAVHADIAELLGANAKLGAVLRQRHGGEGVPRLVIVESPYAGDVEANTAYARRALADSLDRGEAPIASHLLYTQPGVLDDADPDQRAHGIAAGLAWGRFASLTVVYTDRGISPGMEAGIEAANLQGRAVEFRQIGA